MVGAPAIYTVEAVPVNVETVVVGELKWLKKYALAPVKAVVAGFEYSVLDAAVVLPVPRKSTEP